MDNNYSNVINKLAVGYLYYFVSRTRTNHDEKVVEPIMKRGNTRLLDKIAQTGKTPQPLDPDLKLCTQNWIKDNNYAIFGGLGSNYETFLQILRKILKAPSILFPKWAHFCIDHFWFLFYELKCKDCWDFMTFLNSHKWPPGEMLSWDTLTQGKAKFASICRY